MTRDQLDAIRERLDGGFAPSSLDAALLIDEANAMFDALQPSLGTPVPPERRIRRQADVDAAFARGAEAMRTALLQRVDWHGSTADVIRAEPLPEYEP